MKNKILKYSIPVFTNTYSWAILISGIIIWSIAGYFTKYDLSLVNTQQLKAGYVFYYDINGDSITERIWANNGSEFNGIEIYDNDNNKFLALHKLQRDFVTNFTIIRAKDLSKNNKNELIFLTSTRDSIFLNILEFDEQFSITHTERFIYRLHKNFKDGFDVSGFFIDADVDWNNNGYPDIYFTLVAGYSYYPRIICAYDYHNDSFIHTAPAGIHFGETTYSSPPGNRQGYLLPSTFAVENYRPYFDTIPYPDTVGWLTVYNEDLTPVFSPIKFNEVGKIINVNAIHQSDTTYFAVTSSNFRTGSSVEVHIYNQRGDLIKKLGGVEVGFFDIKLPHYMQQTENMAMLFTDKHGYAYFLKSDFSELKKEKIKFIGNSAGLTMYKMDIDLDGKQEYIFTTKNEVVVYDSNFKHPVAISIPNADLMLATVGFNGQHYTLNYNKDNYVYSLQYAENPRYWLRYFVYLGIFALVLSFLYLFQLARTYQLKIENVRLNQTVAERTIEIQKQKEEIEQQTEQLKQTNAKLLENDEFKQNLTAMIVHDLKNPLNYIINQSHNKRVSKAGYQMLNMVSNILDIQKFEDAKIKLTKDRKNLNETIYDAVGQIEYLLDEKKITLLNYVDEGIIADFDQYLIERVLVNYLTNAIKYSPNGSNIVIKSGLPDNKDTCCIKISVIDSGNGIPKEFLPKVFDKFSQHDAQKVGITGSTGLGLTFCKYAVEAHHGQVGVESKMGIGSSFWFVLPVVQADTQHRPGQGVAISANKSPQLSTDDRKYLQPFANQLKDIEIYEYTQLIKILESIDFEKSSGIENWKEEISHAIENFNVEYYNELINTVNDNPAM